MTTPAPESFERYDDPIAEAVRAQILESGRRALDATIAFLALRGGKVEARVAASNEAEAAEMMVAALRLALATYIVAGVDPLPKIRRVDATGPKRLNAFQMVHARWKDGTADALEKKLERVRGSR